MKLITNPDPNNFLLEEKQGVGENAIEIIASVACSEHIFTRGGIASITLTGSLDKSFLRWGRNQIHFNMNWYNVQNVHKLFDIAVDIENENVISFEIDTEIDEMACLVSL